MAAAVTTVTGLAVASPAVAAPSAGSSPSRPAAAARAAAGRPDLGPNVYVFTPSMPEATIQSTVDSIGAQQSGNQFGPQRYALLFEPGTYGSAADPLTFPVGYYTEVAGLGASPADTVINGSVDVYNQCSSTDCNALDNFWRSLSDLTINVAGGTGCHAGTDFWAVSQASPMRRVQVNGSVSLMDYCTQSADASGGFIADSAFTGGKVTNGSQQQWITRNTDIDQWTNGVWNQVFVGDPGAPPQQFPAAGGVGPYTTVATAPVTEEAPFLTDTGGTWSVFVPSAQHDTSGPSWQATGGTPGRSIPLSDFFVARPSTPDLAIDAALARGRDLLLTPGVYDVHRTIQVRRPGTVVLGLGFPTLVAQGGAVAMRTASVPGVRLSGLIFDAGATSSPTLLQVGGGPSGRAGRHAGTSGRAARPPAPTLLADVFFRVGGAEPGRATDSLVVDQPATILDDVWAWRADHGAGVGWTDNTAATGVTVAADDVTAYGLAVEHYQADEVVWTGQGGRDYFFQNEMPYDPPSQRAWMSSPRTAGYPAFVIGSRVTSFQGYGMGSYCYFDQGVPIQSTTAFSVPTRAGVDLHDLLTVWLNGSGSIDSVIDGTGGSVSSANPDTPATVVSYPGS